MAALTPAAGARAGRRRILDHPLVLDAAPTASDRGLALGDGLVGASLWGDGRPLNLSLDRADLWDLRDIGEYHGEAYAWGRVAEDHRAGRHDALKALLEAPYDRAGPTRLPAGRISLTFAAPAVRWRLERASGVAEIAFEGGAVLEAFIDAAGVGRLRVRGDAPVPEVVAPPFGGAPADAAPTPGPSLSRHNAWDLGYPPPIRTQADGLAGFGQEGWGGFAFATALAWRRDGADWRGAWTVVAGEGEPGDLLRGVADPLAAALEDDFEAAAAEQAAWWSTYWSKGGVSLPDPTLERVYYAGMHQFGAAARRGRPPAALQGVWTTDDGRLPPWKGDYHHDLNTQMTYWPACAGNQLDSALGFLDWLWETREACMDWTRRFYGVGGLNVPMTADLKNRQLGGWRQHTHSVATSAWLAHHFHLHWRYSQDRAFLTDRAYPYLSLVCAFVEAISETRDAGGLRTVALSSSPEIGDNRPEAWFGVVTNYDLTLFRWVLDAAADMADALGRGTDASRWRAARAQMPELALSDAGELLIAPGLAYPGHHRHFSHALAVHPLGMLTGFSEDPAARRIAAATTRQILGASKELWMGYSYAWSASLAARVGDGEAARDALLTFADAFVFPNGFHANGDWSGRGVGKARFGAFTLEGALGGADAIQTMLLQSEPGVVRLFPAIPRAWEAVGFDGFLADGAVTVSAAIEDRRLSRVELAAREPTRLRLFAFDQAEELDIALAPGRPRRLAPAELRRLDPPQGDRFDEP